MLKNYKDILSVEELCEILSIGKNTAYRLLKSDEIKSVRIHEYLFPSVGYNETSNIWFKIAENQYVDVIGHCGENLLLLVVYYCSHNLCNSYGENEVSFRRVLGEKKESFRRVLGEKKRVFGDNFGLER